MGNIAEALRAKELELGIECRLTSLWHMCDLLLIELATTMRFFDTLNQVEINKSLQE